jgi:hypothetical protein
MTRPHTHHRFALAAALGLGAIATTASADIIHVPGDHPTIQAAIIASSHGDEIIIAPGEYIEAINFLGRAITVRSQDPSDPAVVAATIINGNGADRVVQCVNGEGSGSVLAGLTITGGRGDFNEPARDGAGMYNFAASPTVRDCVFTGNYAYISGGGMYNEGGSPLIERCRFDNNQAGSGGGMFNWNSNVTARGCTFTANESFEDVGGGLFNVNGTTAYEHCRFYGNIARNEGGAGNQGGTATYTDCEFIGNQAAGCGGGMSVFFGAVVTLRRCTFTGNSAGTCADAIRTLQATPTLIDCVVCSNGDDQIDGAYTDGGGNIISQGCPLAAPAGSCCVNGACVALVESDCTALGGEYQGDFMSCVEATCAPDCPGDITGDGMTNVTDLLALLAAWGACP